MKHAAPTIENAVAAGRPRRASGDRRPGAGAALLVVLDRSVPRPSCAPRPRRSASRSPAIDELGHRAGVRRRSWPPRSARRARGDAARTRRCCSPPTRCRSGSSTPATRTRTSCVPPPQAVAAAAGLGAVEPVGDRLAVGGPHARAVARPRHPAGHRRRSAAAARTTPMGVLVCACGFVADHLEVLYDLDIEAAAPSRGHGPRVRPHGVRQRRPGRDGRARPRGSSPQS